MRCGQAANRCGSLPHLAARNEHAALPQRWVCGCAVMSIWQPPSPQLREGHGCGWPQPCVRLGCGAATGASVCGVFCACRSAKVAAPLKVERRRRRGAAKVGHFAAICVAWPSLGRSALWCGSQHRGPLACGVCLALLGNHVAECFLQHRHVCGFGWPARLPSGCISVTSRAVLCVQTETWTRLCPPNGSSPAFLPPGACAHAQAPCTARAWAPRPRRHKHTKRIGSRAP